MINPKTVLATYKIDHRQQQIEIQPQILSNHSRTIQKITKIRFFETLYQKSKKIRTRAHKFLYWFIQN